jgi:hypothetical protein
VKEDVLEQIVDDYLQLLGYFTIHNVRFSPDKSHGDYDSSQDSVSSDVDVVGIHPGLTGADRVMVVSCKAWQTGFDAKVKLEELREERPNPKRPTWKHFRELWVPKWSEAFRATITDLTGERTFSYRVAVTRLKGDPEPWAQDPRIRESLAGATFDFLTLETMWGTMLRRLKETPASSDIGRLAQLLKAAGLTEPTPVTKPEGPEPGSEAAIQDALESEA